jgi:hypothetical protein
MKRSSICLFLMAVSWSQCAAQPPAGRVQKAVQDGVNWYRLWYGRQSTAPRPFLNSSDAWAAVVGPRYYVALPGIELGVEIDISGAVAVPLRVEELVPGTTGPEAAKGYISLMRREAGYALDPKANRFGLPQRVLNPAFKAALEGKTEILELGILSLPENPPELVGPSDYSQLTAYLRSTQADRLPECRPMRLTVPRFGLYDPIVLILVETTSGNCGSFVLAVWRTPRWRDELWMNRSGDLDELEARIRKRAVVSLEFWVKPGTG